MLKDKPENFRKGVAMKYKWTVLMIVFTLLFLVFFSPPDYVSAERNINDITPFDGIVSTVNGEMHIYNFNGGPPTVPYARFYNRMTQEIYDSAAGELDAKGDVAWADSETLLTNETSTVGGWLINVPDMPKGWYDVGIYERVGGTPASNDTLYLVRFCYIRNNIILSFDER